MKPQISLKVFITLIFLILALVLVIGYSVLSIYFFRKGIDSITAVNMEDVARSYIQSVPPEQRNLLNSYYGFQVASTWEQMPLELQRAFDSPPTNKQNFKISRECSVPQGRPDIINFIFRYEENNEIVYVGRQTYRPPGPNLLSKKNHESKRILLLFSVVIAGILALSILLLYRRIAKPVAALEEWTSALGPENIEQLPPDFSYPELNKMAELVRRSLSSVQESLDREHHFLRYASHELRTPISVIRNNIELVPKVKQLAEPRRSDEQDQLLGRIDRASLNMQYLTETLLWLYRDDIDKLPSKEFALDILVKQLAEEMKYLLDRKDIELKIDTDPFMISVPEIPTQIVLRNLVRNAFQHTLEGHININQRGNVVTISNSQPDIDGVQHNLGFGFGLQLISQLSKKLDWKYVAISEQSTYNASISLNPDG